MIFNQDNSDLISAISAITPLDTTPTNGSTKGITSGAVYTTLNQTSNGNVTKVIENGTLDIYASYCRKKGNMVVACGRIYGIENNDGTNRAYFQIQEGFRPPVQIVAMGLMRIETSSSPAVPYAPTNMPCQALVTTDGKVQIGFGSGVTVSQVAFSVTYFV